MSSGKGKLRHLPGRWLLVASTGLVLLALLPAQAGAAGTGSISGTVTDVAATPAGGVCARAYDAAGDGLNYVSTGETDSDGGYTIEELETGSYRVRFSPCGANVLREWFDDEESFATATSIPVTDGSDTPDIDAQLAMGGSISGRVLNVPGGSNDNTCVDAYRTDSFDSAFANSSANGDYTITGLEAGTYRVRFGRCDTDENVASEYYPDKATRAEATPVSVTAGSDTSGINAELEEGVSISGKMSGGGPDFAPYLCLADVSALDAEGNVLNSDSYEFSSATAGGPDFKIEKLKPGHDYFLRASLGCGWLPSSETYGYTEYYSDKGSLAEATPISVVEGSAVTGIDIELDSPDPIPLAPDTTIDSGPAGTVTTDSVTFTFSSADPANTAGFECALDSGDFADCSSPQTFPSLSDGSHTVSVRAKHAVAGIVDQTPATRTFTVDTAEPVVPKAKISKVSVKGPARIKLGRKATFRVKVTNSGNTRAKGVSIKVKGKGVKVTRPAGSIPAATTRSIKVKVKPRKAGQGKLTFTAYSTNGGGKTVKRRITVIPLRR